MIYKIFETVELMNLKIVNEINYCCKTYNNLYVTLYLKTFKRQIYLQIST